MFACCWMTMLISLIGKIYVLFIMLPEYSKGVEKFLHKIKDDNFFSGWLMKAFRNTCVALAKIFSIQGGFELMQIDSPEFDHHSMSIGHGLHICVLHSFVAIYFIRGWSKASATASHIDSYALRVVFFLLIGDIFISTHLHISACFDSFRVSFYYHFKTLEWFLLIH